jgi:histidine phosphotransfer protein HptB
MGTDEILDRSAIENLLASVGGDREFLNELIDTYFDDTPALFSQMEAALAGGDAPTFQRAAHSLKSNSASFGAMALSGIAKQLESMGKAGDLSAVRGLLDQAASEYERVQTALQILRSEA